MSRQSYGLDAPGVIAGMLGAGAAAVLGGARLVQGRRAIGIGLVGAGLVPTLLGTSMLTYSTLGKLRLRDRILDELDLTGSERVLDVGAGRGLMAVGAARRVTTGEAVAVDLWRGGDLSGNGRDGLRANADAAGVQVDIVDGDAQQLPFPDASFDAVVSVLCLANIGDRAGRQRAVAECLRVLRPGGRLVLADYRLTGEYAATLRSLGQAPVRSGLLLRTGLGIVATVSTTKA